MRITTSLIVNANIKENIQKYLDKHELNQEVIAVTHDKSDPDYIYIVMTKERTKPKYDFPEFHVYTCWNESTQCLNYGEHNVTEQTATEILMGGYARKREMQDGKPNEMRIEELCTKFKDKLWECLDYEEYMGFLRDEAELEENDCEWLEIRYKEMMEFDQYDDEE